MAVVVETMIATGPKTCLVLPGGLAGAVGSAETRRH